MTVALVQCYLSALGAMEVGGPTPLQRRAEFEASERFPGAQIRLDALAKYLAVASLNDALRKGLHLAVSRWDVADADWTGDTPPRSADRRRVIYTRLGIEGSPATVEQFDQLFPLDAEAPVVISDKFEPWYTPERRKQNAFYWPAYSKLLSTHGWSADALAGLDEATARVVERLTDPFGEEARQAKGLVVGYVQSGKTANFTGVIAKSIDAGYRLVVVLTGTIDVLRKQTQRRIDMELVGKENILGGIDLRDAETADQVDYYRDDPDWGKFLEFGFVPSKRNLPDIIRLTGRDFDYKSLKAGIAALEFERVDKAKPLIDPVNLPSS